MQFRTLVKPVFSHEDFYLIETGIQVILILIQLSSFGMYYYLHFLLLFSVQEISRDKDKPKGRAKSHMSMDKNLFLERVIEMGK